MCVRCTGGGGGEAGSFIKFIRRRRRSFVVMYIKCVCERRWRALFQNGAKNASLGFDR